MDGPAAIRSTRRHKRARDWSLVLHSAGIPHSLDEVAGAWLVHVGEGDFARADREIELYEEENRGWPRAAEVPETLAQGALGVGSWCAILLLAYVLQEARALDLPWREAGRVVGERVRAGEWWRAATALTLHADLAHLFGNLVFGALFVGFASEALGSGLALLATLLAGALGNAANVWIHAPAHASLGASTAVFGALGILAGWRLARRRGAPPRGVRWTPLVAALVLFLWLGVGGLRAQDVLETRIDVVAHVCGGLAGVALGLACAPLARELRSKPLMQLALGASAALLLALAWALALR